MTPVIAALMLGAGVTAFVWTQMAKATGNASPTNVAIASSAVGLLAAVVFFTILKTLNF